MQYILKCFDTDLLRFEIVENLADPLVKITWVNEEKKSLLPLSMALNDKELGKWLKHRSIPKNRAFVNKFLAKCGLNANRPMDVISVCKGLSLNDSYWIVEEGFTGSFDQSNLYENNFSNILGWIAFTGYGSNVRSSFDSSPEFTTNGMLPKCWRRQSGKVYLYKGGTSGASNAGNEPYSELYAYKIAEIMGVNAIPYKLSKWKKNLCSVCELFTSKEVSYIPIGRIVREGGMKAVRAYYEKLGPSYVEALNEMIVFDAIIYNTDRHFGNFGLLVDSRNNSVIAPAPLFDHGNSLFNFAGDEYMQSLESLEEYAATLLPRVYEDFVSEAKSVMDDKNKEKVKRLLTFQLKKSGRYNLSQESLDLISEMIRRRARLLLE